MWGFSGAILYLSNERFFLNELQSFDVIKFSNAYSDFDSKLWWGFAINSFLKWCLLMFLGACKLKNVKKRNMWIKRRCEPVSSLFLHFSAGDHMCNLWKKILQAVRGKRSCKTASFRFANINFSIGDVEFGGGGKLNLRTKSSILCKNRMKDFRSFFTTWRR